MNSDDTGKKKNHPVYNICELCHEGWRGLGTFFGKGTVCETLRVLNTHCSPTHCRECERIAIGQAEMLQILSGFIKNIYYI